MRRFVFLLTLLASIITICSGTQKFSRWSFNAEYGESLYYGDIKPISPDLFNSPVQELVFGISVEYALTPVLGISADYYHLPIGGKNNIAYFRTDLSNGGLNATLNFTKMMFPQTKSRFSVNGSLGVGYAAFTSKYKYPKPDSSLLVIKDKPVYASVIPIAFFVEYDLLSSVSIGARAHYSAYFSDNLEGVPYLNFKGVSNDNIAMLSLSLRYKFNAKKKLHMRSINMDNFISRPEIAISKVNNEAIAILEKDNAKLKKSMDSVLLVLSNYLIDSDKDGVLDILDKCPNTPPEVHRMVDINGCPLDTDGDKIADYLDKCPDTALELIGKVDKHGCLTDTDEDGIPDYLDKCPDNAPEAIGMTDNYGCPLDTDGDSIPDYLDKCPDTSPEMRGMVSNSGCPSDLDGDGIVDYLDRCQDTPPEVRGMVDENGCILDTDGDKIPDYLDKCPDTAPELRGMVGKSGCPLDSDGDGIPDYLDKCPDTSPEVYIMVDSSGCPLDTDRDGIPDYLDKCPDTAPEIYGKVDIKGCPLDSDSDSIADYLDKCPNTAPEAHGMVDSVGCPLDTDGDGIADYLDKCPDTAPELLTMIDKNGCPPDKDGDGIADYYDKCPDTSPDVHGMVDKNGCTLDTDGDLIADYLDKCPKLYGVIENNGCPEIKMEVKALFQRALQGIEFETAVAVIKPVSTEILNKIVDILNQNVNYLIEIQGHTDNIGNPYTNFILSVNRAESVRKYLIENGVSKDRITAHGFGDTVPVADNGIEEGRTKNRRVEFIVSFEK